MYPEGVISSDQTALFNHDQIEKVYRMGLIDEEENTFKAKLVQLVNSQNVVSESAPQTIREQEGVAPVVQPEPQAVAPVQPVEVPVPPIGPGLPGYVAPVAPVAQPAPVAPPVPQAQPQPVQSFSNIQFDENGIVVSA
jgi:hypothetical protein